MDYRSGPRALSPTSLFVRPFSVFAVLAKTSIVALIVMFISRPENCGPNETSTEIILEKISNAGNSLFSYPAFYCNLTSL